METLNLPFSNENTEKYINTCVQIGIGVGIVTTVLAMTLTMSALGWYYAGVYTYNLGYKVAQSGGFDLVRSGFSYIRNFNTMPEPNSDHISEAVAQFLTDIEVPHTDLPQLPPSEDGISLELNPPPSDIVLNNPIYSTYNVSSLRRMAKARNIPSVSKMSKAQLIAAIEESDSRMLA